MEWPIRIMTDFGRDVPASLQAAGARAAVAEASVSGGEFQTSTVTNAIRRVPGHNFMASVLAVNLIDRAERDGLVTRIKRGLWKINTQSEEPSLDR